MSGSGRKRSSKWDLRDEPPFEDVNLANDSWPGKGGRSFLHRESRHGWQSPDLVGDNGSTWCDLETNDTRSKHDSGFPSRENIPGSRGSHKSENIDKDCSGYPVDSSWDKDGSYDSRMSPGLDKWRQQSRSQSPRAGWSRSLRGRTRSRSCSRSRSPIRGFRRDSGYADRNRSRSGVSSKLCRDFATGRCRRGDQCHFLHEGKQTYEDNWDVRHRKGGSSNYSTLHETRDNPSRNERPATLCNDFVKGKCRRGASCRLDHHGAAHGLGKGFGNNVSLEEESDRRKRETSIEQGLNREPRRNSDIPCKFFAAGNCRNGRHCRFSHNNQSSTSPDRKYQDERRGPGQKLIYGNQVLGDSKWSDSVTLPTSAKLDEIKNGNIGVAEPRSSAWSTNDNGFRSTLDGENKIGSDPAVGHEAPKCNDGETLGWKAENVGPSMAPSESRHTEDMSPDWNYSIKSSNCVPKEENSLNTLGSEFVSLNDSSLITHDQSIPHDAVALSHDTDATENTALHADLNISANNMSRQSFDQNGQHSGAFPPSMNTIGQNQVVIPTELQRGFLKIPENKIHPPEGKYVSGRDFGDVKTPVVDTGIKMVTSEQLNELTNLSSSLAQLLGNGQLYAALNPNDSMVTSSFANSETVQPIPVVESQKHYDPICDSRESKKPENSDNSLAILPNATIQTYFTAGKSETEQKSLIASSFPGGPCSADLQQSGISTELNCESQLKPKALSEVGNVNNEQVAKENIESQEDSRKIQDNDPLEDKDGKDDGKKGKDAKVIRAFKFALAEFVKELLKPTWKEGQINKDAYKTIVKKVVDKVTGTLQGTTIPQTQEKIDHYLSSSRPKLMKLVQAYVGKVQKG